MFFHNLLGQKVGTGLSEPVAVALNYLKQSAADWSGIALVTTGVAAFSTAAGLTLGVGDVLTKVALVEVQRRTWGLFAAILSGAFLLSRFGGGELAPALRGGRASKVAGQPQERKEAVPAEVDPDD